MRQSLVTLLAVAVFSLTAIGAGAPKGDVLKVLPHLVDKEGRHTVLPSLFSRDAYQAYLRKHPEMCSGMRFDVQWKCKAAPPEGLRLRVEIITSKGLENTLSVLEKPVVARTGWSRWTAVPYDGEAFKQAGKVVAWRVTLLSGDARLGDRASFLWRESRAASEGPPTGSGRSKE